MGPVRSQTHVNVLQEMMDLSPCGLREHLGLNQPIYARTAYGRFGRASEADGGFSWPRRDIALPLRGAFP
jgi:S-adenosylmethionine synthetase